MYNQPWMDLGVAQKAVPVGDQEQCQTIRSYVVRSGRSMEVLRLTAWYMTKLTRSGKPVLRWRLLFQGNILLHCIFRLLTYYSTHIFMQQHLNIGDFLPAYHYSVYCLSNLKDGNQLTSKSSALLNFLWSSLPQVLRRWSVLSYTRLLLEIR